MHVEISEHFSVCGFHFSRTDVRVNECLYVCCVSRRRPGCEEGPGADPAGRASSAVSGLQGLVHPLSGPHGRRLVDDTGSL